MKDFFSYSAQNYTILSLKELDSKNIVPFQNAVINSNRKLITSPSPLGGRAEIVIKNIPELGMVVFKNYFRGGFLRFFNKRHYLKFKQGVRPVNEILFLKKLQELNIPVPDPVAAYYSGNCIYKGGIVTKYINSPYTLAQYCLMDKKKGEAIFREKFLPVFNKIISNRVFHPDFHPGNVIVSNDEDIFIIDFDKACFYEGLEFYLHEQLVNRWNRAVKKYKLPSFLSMDPKKHY